MRTGRETVHSMARLRKQQPAHTFMLIQFSNIQMIADQWALPNGGQNQFAERRGGLQAVLGGTGGGGQDIVYVVICVIFLFAVNKCNKRIVTSSVFFFFAVITCKPVLAFTGKKVITRRDNFFDLALAAKKNYTT